MTLIEYLKSFDESSLSAGTRTYITCSLEDRNITNKPIPQSIELIILALSQGTEITEAQLADFTKEIAKPEHEHPLGSLLSIQCENIYKKHESLLLQMVKEIEENPCDAKLPALESKDSNLIKNKTFLDLLNAHLISSQLARKYPQGISRYRLPFAVNIFRLAIIRKNGVKPDFGKYCGIDLNLPFYPNSVNRDATKRFPIERGTKNSDLYFPYRVVHKIAKHVGFKTFVAMDDRGKQLFVLDSHSKNSNDYSATAIFAAKVATVVSKKHFASARLLDNHLVASRKLEAYQQPLIDAKDKDFLEEALEQKAEIEGAGLVDEVLNFIGETDKNFENFGLQAIPNSNVKVICKIDYDRCKLLPKNGENYEWKHGLAKVHPRLIDQKKYLPEKCYARLKLALFPRELFEALAKKAYKNTASELKTAVKEYCNRANLALHLLCKDPALIAQLKAKKINLNEILEELKAYINNHFDPTISVIIIKGLVGRKDVVVTNLVAALGPISKEEKLPENAEKLLQFIMDLDARLKKLSKYRQNFFGGLVKMEAVNFQHRLKLESKLAFYQFQLRCHKNVNVDSIKAELNEDIKTYQLCLTNNKKDNTSRYLEDLGAFLNINKLCY